MQPQVFSTFEEYGAAIQHASVRVTITGVPRAPWGVMHLPLGDLALQWGQAGGAHIAEGEGQGGGISLMIPLANAAAITGNGHRYDNETFMLVGAGAEFWFGVADYNQWASVFVPEHRLPALCGDAIPVAPYRCAQIRPEPAAAERLRAVVRRIIADAHGNPDHFAAAAACEAAQAGLTDALWPVLQPAGPSPAALGRHAIPREQIIRTVTDLLSHHLDEMISVERLATAADVSERTLRSVFNDYYGVSPHRYVKLKTLHQARRALREADPATTTVTSVAAHLGVWEFGRFAHEYHDLFGEVPSQTLCALRQQRRIASSPPQ